MHYVFNYFPHLFFETFSQLIGLGALWNQHGVDRAVGQLLRPLPSESAAIIPVRVVRVQNHQAGGGEAVGAEVVEGLGGLPIEGPFEGFFAPVLVLRAYLLRAIYAINGPKTRAN